MLRWSLLAGSLLLFPTVVHADPITFGSFHLTPDRATIHLDSESFTFDGQPSPSAGAVLPWSCMLTPCARGAMDLDARWNGTDLPGTITSGGTLYADAASVSSGQFLDLHWLGTMPARPGRVRAPFTFEGTFFNGERSLDLTGSGIATAQFKPLDGGLSLAKLDYVFGKDTVPNPEPASLVLMATGAGWLWRQKRRHPVSKP